MVKVVWTKRALEDLMDIGDFISRDSIQYASLTINKIVNMDIVIAENPKIGRIVPELNDKNIREIIKGNYRIIYQIRKKTSAYILTVFHSSRLLSKENIG